MGHPPPALEQRGVGDLVDQGVLEAVGGLRRAGRLVEELEAHQLAEGAVEAAAAPPTPRAAGGARSPADHGGNLEQPAGRRRASRSMRAASTSCTGPGPARPRAPRPGSTAARVSSSRKSGLPSAWDRMRSVAGSSSAASREHRAYHVAALVGRQQRQRELGGVGAIRPARAVSGPIGARGAAGAPASLLDQRRRTPRTARRSSADPRPR